jgi:hypothetical protein
MTLQKNGASFCAPRCMPRLPDSIRHSDTLEASAVDLIEAVREQGFGTGRRTDSRDGRKSARSASTRTPLPGKPRAPREKFRARVKPSALMRRTRSKLALPRPGSPVRVDLSRRDFLHVSLDTDVPALRLPVECERRARIAAQLAPLAASGWCERAPARFQTERIRNVSAAAGY